MEVCVIVLGDLARSPRMLNHVSMLLSHNYKVTLIGYEDSPLPSSLKSNPSLKIKPLKTRALNSLKKLSSKLFLLYAALRLFIESLQLFLAIISSPKTRFILVQNPPSMPVFIIVYICSCILNIKFIIDWHNYAWSLLKIANRGKAVVKLAYFYENTIGYLADASFCVSSNMQSDLQTYKISATVLYDRPIHRSPIDKDMRKELSIPSNSFFIVSSTSYTVDEDFSIVLNALDILSQTNLHIFLLITGKGPLQDYYRGLISQKNWENITVKMAWLAIEDYPLVLRQADLGICLHISSSGLDLPMKIVDMQEACLPALAYKYQSIGEFVQDGVNGELFANENQLSQGILVNHI